MNKLTGLDDLFMRDHEISEPPDFLHGFIEAGLVTRASISTVKEPAGLKGLRSLNLEARDRADYKVVTRMLCVHGWLPQSRCQWSADTSRGSIFCINQDDLDQWARHGFQPLPTEE